MTRVTSPSRWLPELSRRNGPTYRAIADALEADVQAGRLGAGDPLPTHRELAEQLGVNFTTVTRAYAEARRRGLLTATVGRGTFVADPATRRLGSSARSNRDHDLSVNAPPVPAWLPSVLRDTIIRFGGDAGLVHTVLTYEARLGDAEAREAGAAWLRGRGLVAEAGRVVVTVGAQHALSLLLSTITRPGDVVLTEALAYPGLHGAAAFAGVRLVGVEIDDEGLRPDKLDQACERLQPKALFCVPTLQNPTTAVMSLERRQEILAIARRRRLRIVEDDICGPLFPDAAPLASLAPDVVIHVASLSKCVAPGLRVAYVLLPTADDAARLGAAVRASVLMLSPLPVAVASAWVTDGTAQRVVDDIRVEATARVALARRLLDGDRLVAPRGSLHAWMRLPASWSLAAFVAQAQQQGVRVAPADWYVTPSDVAQPVPPAAVRLTLGAEPDRASLESALRTLATILAQPVGLRASNL